MTVALKWPYCTAVTDDKVKNGMYKLACSLKDEDYEEAEKIQRGLNVDYPSICTPWMIAIRQLILALKQ